MNPGLSGRPASIVDEFSIFFEVFAIFRTPCMTSRSPITRQQTIMTELAHARQEPKITNPPTRSSGGGSASIPVYRILRQIDYLARPDGRHARPVARQQRQQARLFAGWATDRMVFRLPEC